MNKALSVVACLAFAPFAHAQESRGMYIGGGLGNLDYAEPEDVSLPMDDSSWTYHLFGGYQFNDYFALEVGITGTGSDLEADFTEDIGPPFGVSQLEENYALDIYSLHAVGFLPLNNISLFAGAGYFSASVSATLDLSGFGTVGAGTDHTSGASAMFGIQKNFGLDLENFSVRGYYQWYDWENDVDASSIVIGATYRF